MCTYHKIVLFLICIKNLFVVQKAITIENHLRDHKDDNNEDDNINIIKSINLLIRSRHIRYRESPVILIIQDY